MRKDEGAGTFYSPIQGRVDLASLGFLSHPSRFWDFKASNCLKKISLSYLSTHLRLVELNQQVWVPCLTRVDFETWNFRLPWKDFVPLYFYWTTHGQAKLASFVSLSHLSRFETWNLYSFWKDFVLLCFCSPTFGWAKLASFRLLVSPQADFETWNFYLP